MQNNDGHDQVLQRLFAEGGGALSAGDFPAMLAQRLRRLRRRRLLCRAMAAVVALAALVAVAPALVHASVATCAYLSGGSIRVGDGIELPLVWVVTGAGSALVLLLSLRGLKH